MRNAECGMQNAECGMQNAEFRMQNAETLTLSSHSLLSLFPGANLTLITYLMGTGARDGASVGVFRLPFLSSSFTGQRSRLSGMV